MKQWVVVTGVLAIALAPRTAAGTIGQLAERLGAPICADLASPARHRSDADDRLPMRVAPRPVAVESVTMMTAAGVTNRLLTPGHPMFDAPCCAAEPPLACTGATLQSPDRLDRADVPGPLASIDPGACKAVRTVENSIAFTDTFVRWIAILFLAIIMGVPVACASAARGIAELGESPARAPPHDTTPTGAG